MPLLHSSGPSALVGQASHCGPEPSMPPTVSQAHRLHKYVTLFSAKLGANRRKWCCTCTLECTNAHCCSLSRVGPGCLYAAAPHLFS